MKIFHYVNASVLFTVIYSQGVENFGLLMNTDTTRYSLVVHRLPNIPLLMSSGREFIVTSIPPNGVGEAAQITPLMRLKVGGGLEGCWGGGCSGEPSHCRRNQWRRAPVAAANVSVGEASPPSPPSPSRAANKLHVDSPE